MPDWFDLERLGALLNAIAITAAIALAFAYLYCRRSARDVEEAMEPIDVTIEAAPIAAIDDAAHAIVTARHWPGPARIIERTSESVEFEIGPSKREGRAVKGKITARSRGQRRTSVEASMNIPRSGTLVAAHAILIIGALVLVGGWYALRTWVLSHELPPIRFQVIQMMQIIHFIWPPFMLSYAARREMTKICRTRYRNYRTTSVTEFENSLDPVDSVRLAWA